MPLPMPVPKKDLFWPRNSTEHNNRSDQKQMVEYAQSKTSEFFRYLKIPYATVLTSAAALAFSTGELTSSEAL
jgi:hypothetical protein